MTWTIEDILNKERNISGDYHLHVARGWRLFGGSKLLHSPLAYAAFEYRLTIERFLVELLYFVREGKLSKSDKNAIENVDRLVKLLYKIYGSEERLNKFMIFTRLQMQYAGTPPNLIPKIINVRQLNSYWRSLSDYCHKQLHMSITWSSENNFWVQKGYNFLKEVEDYLWDISVASPRVWPLDHSPHQELEDACSDFLNGKITQEILENRLNIMVPILIKRHQNQS